MRIEVEGGVSRRIKQYKVVGFPLYTLGLLTIDAMVDHMALYLVHLIDDHGYQRGHRVSTPQPEFEMEFNGFQEWGDGN